MKTRSFGMATLVAALGLGTLAHAEDLTASLQKGTPALKSAGNLAFGPDGILFVADTQGGAVFAIATGDTIPAPAHSHLKVVKLDESIAAALGTTAKAMKINDLAINPASGNAYLSVARGTGPDAAAAIVRVDGTGKVDVLSLKDVAFAKAMIPNPANGNNPRNGRSEAITDLAFVGKTLYVAGLSNEEFSSRLLAIPFPFVESGDGTSLEIFHGAHGGFETKSPIRTFVPFTIKGEPYLMAAYTCTPLVKIPVADLKPGTKIRGTTVAELGNMNRPIDMVAYSKDGKDYLLLANSARGVMKIAADGLDKAAAIAAPVKAKTEGVGYETIQELANVEQLDGLDKNHAVVLIRRDGALNLETIDLP